MDYVKEIERLQKEQEQRLRAAVASEVSEYAELKEDVVEAAAKRAYGDPDVSSASVSRSRATAAPPPQAQKRQRGNQRQQPQGSDMAVRAATRVGANVLLVPAIVLLSFGLAHVETAWNGTHLDALEGGLFVFLPILAALMVLRVRRHMLRTLNPALAAKGRLRPTAQVIGGSVRTLIFLAVLIMIGATISTDFLPDGLPVLQWWQAWQAGGIDALLR